MSTTDLGPPFETKSEWVYARLREMITRGEFRSGERLRLSQLARRFRTSEMPVREALRMLQRDGLVDMESHRGATVARVTWERVYEAVMIRMHLEVLAAREAIAHHNAETLGAIEELLRRMDHTAERNRVLEYSEANRRFHTLLYEPCPYGLLKEEIQSLWDAMWRTRSQSLFRLSPERMAGAQREHWALFRALKRRDPGRVTALAEEHMLRTLEAWKRALERAAPLES
ncbi:MAG: GntR family transcriptional regulator [Actinobacteria bacterium]|nr:GntR family transcriptional regulator [Actinomycetota bacterium]